jgi:AcrR family transcriptional regulator
VRKNAKLAVIGKAACGLFRRNGYFETSLEDIAAEAKVSKGALYHYFPSKTSLLYFILKRFGDKLLEGLQADLDKIEDGFAKVHFIVKRHINLSVEYRDEATALINAKYSLSRKYLKVVKGQEKRYYEIVSGVISDLMGKNMSRGELTALTFSLFGMCNWIYTWYDPKGEISPDALSEIIYTTFCNGVSSYVTCDAAVARRGRAASDAPGRLRDGRKSKRP